MRHKDTDALYNYSDQFAEIAYAYRGLVGSDDAAKNVLSEFDAAMHKLIWEFRKSTKALSGEVDGDDTISNEPIWELFNGPGWNKP